MSEPRLVALLKKLETFGTRNTLSSIDSPTRGIGAARQWIFDEMKSYSPSCRCPSTLTGSPTGPHHARRGSRNVMAILPGRSPRRIYISGHYDTIAINGGQSGSNAGPRPRRHRRPQPADPNAPNDSPAAGVNDDGSGTSLTIELARVFSQSGLDFDATLVFMCHVAEEQGLMGAKLHAQKARNGSSRIDAVLNNDIVGNARAATASSTAPRFGCTRKARRTRRHASLRGSCSGGGCGTCRRTPCGRSHGPTGSRAAATIRRTTSTGFAAVGFRESREDFSRQHDPRDTFDGLSPAYLAQNARVNAAAAATLALAPPAPGVLNERGQANINRAPSGYDAHLMWTASPARRPTGFSGAKPGGPTGSTTCSWATSPRRRCRTR